MDRRVVEDVHWLLGNWDPAELDVTVSLELLSMDFADTMVRQLAVQRLESLSNDDVLKYLLQLVQVLYILYALHKVTLMVISVKKSHLNYCEVRECIFAVWGPILDCSLMYMTTVKGLTLKDLQSLVSMFSFMSEKAHAAKYLLTSHMTL